MSITKKTLQIAIALSSVLYSFSAFAEEAPKVKVEGYIDSYYAFDTDMSMLLDKDKKEVGPMV